MSNKRYWQLWSICFVLSMMICFGMVIYTAVTES